MIVDKMTERERTELTAVMWNCIFTNEVAVGAVCDALERVEDSGLCRQRVRFWSGRCRKEYKDYNRLLDQHTGGRIGTIADVNDAYDEVVKMDIWKLRNAVRMALGRAKWPKPKLTGDLFLANLLISCSVHNIEHCTDSFPHLNYVRRRFQWMRLLRLRDAMGNLTDELKKAGAVRHGYEALLGNDQTVETGIRALAIRLHDGDGIIRVCNQVSVDD